MVSTSDCNTINETAAVVVVAVERRNDQLKGQQGTAWWSIDPVAVKRFILNGKVFFFLEFNLFSVLSLYCVVIHWSCCFAVRCIDCPFWTQGFQIVPSSLHFITWMGFFILKTQEKFFNLRCDVEVECYFELWKLMNLFINHRCDVYLPTIVNFVNSFVVLIGARGWKGYNLCRKKDLFLVNFLSFQLNDSCHS